MFIGEHSHSIDEKGRLSIPAKFRPAFKQGIIITRGVDHCLWLYTMPEWRRLAEKLAALPITQQKSLAFARLMLAGAWDAKLDSQGRVIVPDYLREFGNISKQVIVAGLLNRVEIWDAKKWAEYKKSAEQNSEDIAAGMAELGV